MTNFNENDYQKMLKIYKKKATSLTVGDIETYDTLVNNLKFHKDTLVRLIGDELADRGSNDYFTLKILEKMHAEKVPMEIILSNHGLEFLRACKNANASENNKGFHGVKIEQVYASSVVSLNKLVKRGLVEKEDIIRISNTAYEPKLKAISYSINPNNDQITIFSHAPIGLENIKNLAVQFNVEYQDSTSEQLAQTIDSINKKFKYEDHLKNKIFEHKIEDKNNALIVAIWNRDYKNLNRPQKLNGFNLAWVHGHDSNDPKIGLPHITNLNNELGQLPLDNKGDLGIYLEKLEFLSATLGALIEEIKTKATKLAENGHIDAAKAAHTLYRELSNSLRIDTADAFITRCKESIDFARPTLQEHRGFEKIFKSIRWVLFYLRLITSPIKETDSVLKLDALVNELEKLKTNPGESKAPTDPKPPSP